MPRRNFAEVINSDSLDVTREFSNLADLVYQDGFYKTMESYFSIMPFKGLALDLDDFDRRNNFSFFAYKTVTIDDLLSFCEYVYNFGAIIREMWWLQEAESASRVCSHVEAVVNAAGHQLIPGNVGLYIAVPVGGWAQAAADSVTDEVSAVLLEYRYRGYERDLRAKARILADLSRELEPRRNDLERLAGKATGNLFQGLNRWNIRHNNLDSAHKNYSEEFAALSDEEKEARYDALYSLCCASFLLLDYADKLH